MIFGFGKKNRERREAKLLSEFATAVGVINQKGAEYKVQAGLGLALLYVVLLDTGDITTIPEFAEQNKSGRTKIIKKVGVVAYGYLDEGAHGHATGGFMFRMWLQAIDQGHFQLAMDMQEVLGDLLHTWWESLEVSAQEANDTFVFDSKVPREQMNRVWAQADEWLWYRLHPDLKPTSTVTWTPSKELEDLVRRNRSSDSDIFTKPSKPRSLDTHRFITITPAQATRGCKVRVKTETGTTISLNIPKNTRSGRKLRVAGEGKKMGDRVGDLYVAVNVDSTKDGN